MKKSKSRRRTTAAKRKSGPASKGRAAAKTVDEYIAGIPEPARGIVQELRAAIRAVVPAESTEVISYGPGVPAETGAGLVRRVFKPLQLVSRECSD